MPPAASQFGSGIGRPGGVPAKVGFCGGANSTKLPGLAVASSTSVPRSVKPRSLKRSSVRSNQVAAKVARVSSLPKPARRFSVKSSWLSCVVVWYCASNSTPSNPCRVMKLTTPATASDP